MSEIKSNKLPVKIIANSAETFAKLEAIIKKLPDGFLKQFETVEEQPLVYNILLKSRPLSEDFLCIGNILRIKQERKKIEYLSSMLNKYDIVSDIIIGGKNERLRFELLMYESSPLSISATTNCEIK